MISPDFGLQVTTIPLTQETQDVLGRILSAACVEGGLEAAANQLLGLGVAAKNADLEPGTYFNIVSVRPDLAATLAVNMAAQVGLETMLPEVPSGLNVIHPDSQGVNYAFPR